MTNKRIYDQPISICEMSGFWGCPSKILHARMLVNDNKHFIANTEVDSAHRSKALKMPGWRKAQDPRHAYGEVALNNNVEKGWVLKKSKTFKIGPDLGPGDIEVVQIAYYKHRITKKKKLLLVTHLPASVEQDWDGHRADVWRDCFAKIIKIIKRWKLRYRPHVIVWTGDFNMDALKPWVRVEFKELLPPWLRLVMPPGPTHGNRAIDLFIVWGLDKARQTIARKTKASDHCETTLLGMI